MREQFSIDFNAIFDYDLIIIIPKELVMTLEHWIKKQGKKKIDIARRLGITPGHMSALCLRKNPPSYTLALKIVELTGGEVSYEELAPRTEEKEAA